MVFVSFRIFFSDNTRVRIFIYFVAQSANFFLKDLTLDYMTKTLNQIIFFPPPKSKYFFSNIGNRIIFF
jgi:Fe-S cluster assembly iron-binding protein IscA